MWNKKNRWSLVVFAVIVLLLIGSIFFLWMKANVEVRSIVEEQYQTQQLILTQYVSYSIGELLNERVLLLEVVAQKQQGVPEDLFMSEFETVYEVADIYYVLEFIDVNGTVVSGYPVENVPLGFNLYSNNMTWAFEHVRDTGQVYISEPVSTMEGIFGAYAWVPVFENGQFRGSILGIVSDENIIKQFETTSDSSNYVYIVNDKGMILYDQSATYEKGTNYLDHTDKNDTDRLHILDAQMRGMMGNGKYWQETPDGSEYVLVSYSPVNWYNQRWSVGLTSPGDAVDDIILSVYVKLFTVAAVSVLFILFVSSQVYIILLNWNKTLEREVEKKTRELQESNESLTAVNIKLKELDGLKNEFLSMVSHELKTPLTAMKTSSEFLLEDRCDPAVRNQLLALIVRNVDRQARLVDDLLDISRIESNRMKFNMEPVSLQEVLDHSIENIHRLSESKGVALGVDIPRSLPAVLADRDKLIQIFVNLLNNAVKFTQRAGSVTVLAQESGDNIEVIVSDTGIGIDPSHAEHIFDKFYQIDSTSTRTAGGCGLGLAITKGLVEGMNGSIRVESEPGIGSRFIVTLKKAGI
ncbi:MAG: sensor histidine kinase [Methanolobus sp.]|uniref:sensor histidine kinase n=1 Tax=Methanolobus sp. TaxID=1874737 RepID=UPI0027313A0F|nr:sensor histidine kinase [Methanolobus sp.]MDP2216815.1 sensor histidine kinase [Methanolobus sp.]